MIKYATLLLLFVCLISCSSNPEVKIQTSAGSIVVELYLKKAPVTAGNFLKLVNAGVYKNSLFYRTVKPDNQPLNKVKIEVIQGGLFYDSLVNKIPVIPHETTLETGILHKSGVISMARDKPGTASSEFFICIGDQPSLDYGGKRNPDGQGFAAFGKVIKGMTVVRKIQMMSDSGQYLRPPVKILNMRQIK